MIFIIVGIVKLMVLRVNFDLIKLLLVKREMLNNMNKLIWSSVNSI